MEPVVGTSLNGYNIKLPSCGSLSESKDSYVCSNWWSCLGKMRKYGPVGGRVSLGVEIEVSKDS